MAIIATGKHGEPFQFQTKSYHNTLANGYIAKAALEQNLSGSLNLAIVIHENVNYATAFNTLFQIKSVIPSEPRLIPFTSRAINHSNGPLAPACELVCDWTLIPIYVEADPPEDPPEEEP